MLNKCAKLVRNSSCFPRTHNSLLIVGYSATYPANIFQSLLELGSTIPHHLLLLHQHTPFLSASLVLSPTGNMPHTLIHFKMSIAMNIEHVCWEPTTCWNQLRCSGESDKKMRHGSCPMGMHGVGRKPALSKCNYKLWEGLWKKQMALWKRWVFLRLLPSLGCLLTPPCLPEFHVSFTSVGKSSQISSSPTCPPQYLPCAFPNMLPWSSTLVYELQKWCCGYCAFSRPIVQMLPLFQNEARGQICHCWDLVNIHLLLERKVHPVQPLQADCRSPSTPPTCVYLTAA